MANTHQLGQNFGGVFIVRTSNNPALLFLDCLMGNLFYDRNIEGDTGGRIWGLLTGTFGGRINLDAKIYGKLI